MGMKRRIPRKGRETSIATSPATANQKGRILEEAVGLIERKILKHSPGLQDFQFRIEQRKIIHIDGVRHEIDLYVTVLPAAGYQAVFIFECKNWESKVGPAEVIAFSEKIRVTGAQRGFLLAKAFSRYAAAQAKLDRRVELLPTTIEFADAIIVPFFAGVVLRHVRHRELELGVRSEMAGPIAVAASSILLNGVDTKLENLIEGWTNEAMEAQLPSDKMVNDYASREGGSYPQPNAEYVCSFKPGELVVDGSEVVRARLRVEFDVVVATPSLIVDVKGRGRLTRVEMPAFGGLRVELIEPPRNE